MKLTEEDIIKQLNELSTKRRVKNDPEYARSEADKLLLSHVSEDIADAYKRVMRAAPWW